MKIMQLGLALVACATFTQAEYTKIWAPRMSSQLKGASDATKPGGYWFSYNGSTYKVSPASGLPLKNNIVTNKSFLGVSGSGTFDWGAAGFDFYDNGDIEASLKTPYGSFGNNTRLCIVLDKISAAGVVKVVAKQTDTENDGKDPFVSVDLAGSQTVDIALADGFGNQSGGNAYDITKLVGLELAFQKTGSFNVLEVGLTDAGDCSAAGASPEYLLPSTTTAENPEGSAVRIWGADSANKMGTPGTDAPGYWFTTAADGPTILPATKNIPATVTKNTAMVAHTTWTYTKDGANAALGFDFMDNGTSTNKAVFDLSAYEGICVGYSANDDRVAVAIKQKGAADDGSDYVAVLGKGSGKVFLPWTDFAQPKGLVSSKYYALDLTQATGLQFVFQGFSSKLAVSELWLGNGCPAVVAEAPSAATTTTVATSSSSSSSVRSSSSARSSSSTTPVLQVAASKGFGITEIGVDHISYYVNAGQAMQVYLMGPRGDVVAKLYDGYGKGHGSIALNRGALKPGVYMVKLVAGSNSEVATLMAFR